MLTVIFNPAAGRGRGARCKSRIEIALPRAQIWEATRASDGAELARGAVERGADLVVAAGGDGAPGEVLQGILGSGATLGVLPLGMGNDFARCLGVGTRLNSALETLQSGEARSVDVGRVEIGGRTRVFLNIAGAGFDSRVAARINGHAKTNTQTPQAMRTMVWS